jgi:hypothetical protein
MPHVIPGFERWRSNSDKPHASDARACDRSGISLESAPFVLKTHPLLDVPVGIDSDEILRNVVFILHHAEAAGIWQ